MPKGKKKRKQRREMPPLPLLDKILYWFAGAAMLAALVGLLFLWLRWGVQDHQLNEEEAGILYRLFRYTE